jgi:sec-independent protein translocase protein TatA
MAKIEFHRRRFNRLWVQYYRRLLSVAFEDQLMLHILAFGMPGVEEWIVIAIIGVVVFGKKLPEVGRSLGKGIVEFKKGLKGIDEEVEQASSMPAPVVRTAPPTLPGGSEPFKFDPVTGQPLKPAIPEGAKFDPFTGKPLGADPSV